MVHSWSPVIHYSKWLFSRLSRNDKTVGNYFTSMLDYIVMQVRKVERGCRWPVHSDRVLLCKRFKRLNLRQLPQYQKLWNNLLNNRYVKTLNSEMFQNVRTCQCPGQAKKNLFFFHQSNNQYNLHRKLCTLCVYQSYPGLLCCCFFSLLILTCFNSHFSGEVILWTLRLEFGSSSSNTGTTGIPAGLETQCTDKNKLWQ